MHGKLRLLTIQTSSLDSGLNMDPGYHDCLILVIYIYNTLTLLGRAPQKSKLGNMITS